MSIAETHGISMHYELFGNPELPVLVLSHSLGVNLSMWQPQLEELATRRRLLLYDVRGHGSSVSPAGPYSVADLGGDLLGLLDSLGIGKADFCGLSMGGLIGQWLGTHAPERLHSLVLANTAAKIGTTESWNARIETVERDGLGVVVPGTLERWFTPAFRATQPATVAEIGSMLRGMNPGGYISCCAAIRDADFREKVKTISVPTLLISGSHDPVTPPHDLRSLAASIAGSEYVEVSAAHLSSVEAADSFNQALLRFLR